MCNYRGHCLINIAGMITSIALMVTAFVLFGHGSDAAGGGVISAAFTIFFATGVSICYKQRRNPPCSTSTESMDQQQNQDQQPRNSGQIQEPNDALQPGVPELNQDANGDQEPNNEQQLGSSQENLSNRPGSSESIRDRRRSCPQESEDSSLGNAEKENSQATAAEGN